MVMFTDLTKKLHISGEADIIDCPLLCSGLPPNPLCVRCVVKSIQSRMHDKTQGFGSCCKTATVRHLYRKHYLAHSINFQFVMSKRSAASDGDLATAEPTAKRACDGGNHSYTSTSSKNLSQPNNCMRFPPPEEEGPWAEISVVCQDPEVPAMADKAIVVGHSAKVAGRKVHRCCQCAKVFPSSSKVWCFTCFETMTCN